MTQKVISDRDELRQLIEEAVRQGFSDVGIRAEDAAQTDERRRDFQFLHDLRKSSDSAKSKVGAFVLITAAGGVLAMLWDGFRLWLFKH